MAMASPRWRAALGGGLPRRGHRPWAHEFRDASCAETYGGQSVECQIDCETANCIETGHLRTAMGLHATAVDDTRAAGPARGMPRSTKPSNTPCSTCGPNVEVPPIPPHVTYDQMKSTAEAIIKGDLLCSLEIAEMGKNKAAELLPH